MAGVTFIITFGNYVFEEIAKSGAKSSLTTLQQASFIGVSSFIGAILAGLVVKFFSRRGLFIGGSTIIGVSMILIGVFI